jgi:hypothetical protein
MLILNDAQDSLTGVDGDPLNHAITLAKPGCPPDLLPWSDRIR